MKAEGQGVGQDVLEEVFFPTGLRQRTYNRLINAEHAENPTADPRGSEAVRCSLRSDGRQSLKSLRGPAAVARYFLSPAFIVSWKSSICLFDYF